MRGGGPGNAGEDLNYLEFQNENTKYEVYEEYSAEDNKTSVGIKVNMNNSRKEVDIKGLPKSIRGSLVPLRYDYPIPKKEIGE